MTIVIDGSGTITGASTLATTVASPTLTTPNIDSAQFATVSGTAPIYPCRAWVNFNGTGTPAIRGSGNVSSITDNGTGDYTVNFTTAMSDGNYVVSGSVTSYGFSPAVSLCPEAAGVFPTSNIRTLTVSSGGVLVDRGIVNVAIFR